MAMVINTNIASLNAQRNLRKTTGPLNKAMQRLSSGLRINSASDDAAGLAIATRMDSQIRGLTVAMRNANDALSFIQTAEGAVNEMIGDVERIYELAVQSASHNTAQDRRSMNVEVKELISELERIVTQTRFNGEKFLNQSASWIYQVGAQVDETITMNTNNLSPTAMGVTSTSMFDWQAKDVAKGAWSIYKGAMGDDFTRDVRINGIQLGGRVHGNEILNNSRIMIERANKYTEQTNVNAMSFGNALVGSQALSLMSNGVAANAGFLTINGISIGSVSKAEISKDERTRIEAKARAEAEVEWSNLSGEERDKRTEKIHADILAKINSGDIKPQNDDEKKMSKEELADQKTSEYIQKGGQIDEKVHEAVNERLSSITARNMASVVNDKSAETGISAFVVSSSRLLFANNTGGGITYTVDMAKIKSEKGDAFKDINFGLNAEGGRVEGGQNGIMVFNDKRFGQGAVEFDSIKTAGLFGYGMVTLNGESDNVQKIKEVNNKVFLNKKSVADLTITNEMDAKLTMMVTEEVLDRLNGFKAIMGAKMNRIDSTIRNLDNVRENISAAKSRILDADFASETADLTKSMILQQAGISVLSQANSQPQNVLQLLQK